MLASFVGAYQTAYAGFAQRADSGIEVSRIKATEEKSEFKNSLNNVETRAGADETAASQRGRPRPQAQTGRGQFVDILA